MKTAFLQPIFRFSNFLIFAVVVCGQVCGVRLGPVAVYPLHADDAQLGMQEVLLAVKAEIARQHVGNRACQRKQRDALPAEYLDGKADGRQRAVGAAAEQRNHAQRRAQLRRQTQQRRGHTAERRAGEEDRYDLAALEACAQGQRGEQHL